MYRYFYSYAAKRTRIYKNPKYLSARLNCKEANIIINQILVFIQERNSVLYLEPKLFSQLIVITQLLQHYIWNRMAINSQRLIISWKIAIRYFKML